MFPTLRKYRFYILAGISVIGVFGGVLLYINGGEATFKFLTGAGFISAVVWAVGFSGRVREGYVKLRDDQTRETELRRKVQVQQDASIAQMTVTLSQMSAMLHSKEMRIAALSDDLERAEKRQDYLEEKLVAAIALTDIQRLTIAQLHDENTQQAATMRNMQQEIDRLKFLETAQSEIVRTLQGRITDLTEIVAERDKTIAAIEAKIDAR